MTRGRSRPPEVVACVSCTPGKRCEVHRSTYDQLATERKLRNGTHARAPWFADVPVPFIPIGLELEERAPTSSSEPPFQPRPDRVCKVCGMVNPPKGHADWSPEQRAAWERDQSAAVSQAASEDVSKASVAVSSFPAQGPKPPTTSPDSLAPTTTTTFTAPDSGRSFLDAGPMLARATLRKELEFVVLRWLELREHVRGAGRDAWEGRRSSPREMARAEAEVERVAKKLREIR